MVLTQKYWREGLDPAIREKDEQALAVFKQVFPDRTIIPIDSYELNLYGGGVHCWTKNVFIPQKSND